MASRVKYAGHHGVRSAQHLPLSHLFYFKNLVKNRIDILYFILLPHAKRRAPFSGIAEGRSFDIPVKAQHRLQNLHLTNIHRWVRRDDHRVSF
jgi:hypothetical protein